MSNFRGPSMVPDVYRPAKRSLILNYSDGTAGATTRHYLGTVDTNTWLELDAQVITAFNGSTPSVDVVLESAAGVVLQTLMVAATAAVTTASVALKTRCGLLATAKADVVAKYQRPASGSTAGQAVFSLTASKAPSQDSSLATGYSVP